MIFFFGAGESLIETLLTNCNKHELDKVLILYYGALDQSLPAVKQLIRTRAKF